MPHTGRALSEVGDGVGEAAWAAASREGPKSPPLVRAGLSLMQRDQTQPGVATDLRTPVYTACFMILLLTKPTSAFKLLTVEVHLPGGVSGTQDLRRGWAEQE